MYKSSLRHIHDPVISSLKMKCILSFFPLRNEERPTTTDSNERTSRASLQLAFKKSDCQAFVYVHTARPPNNTQCLNEFRYFNYTLQENHVIKGTSIPCFLSYIISIYYILSESQNILLSIQIN
jgi:hypothetical protein